MKALNNLLLTKEASSLGEVNISDFDDETSKLYFLSEKQITKILKHLLVIKLLSGKNKMRKVISYSNIKEKFKKIC